MKKLVLLFLVNLFITAGFSQTTKYFTVNGVALKGYDAVAYFQEQKAVTGTDEFTTNWSGSKWMFSSKANLDSFVIAPQKYAPQYGGYCAYGCSESHTSPTDPTAFTIVNDKLYLNYNAKVKNMWIKDTTARIKSADAFWQTQNN